MSPKETKNKHREDFPDKSSFSRHFDDLTIAFHEKIKKRRIDFRNTFYKLSNGPKVLEIILSFDYLFNIELL